MKTDCNPERATSFDARLERTLTRKRVMSFQLWQVLLLILISVPLIDLFAAAAIKGAEKNAGSLQRAAVAAADVPRTG